MPTGEAHNAGDDARNWDRLTALLEAIGAMSSSPKISPTDVPQRIEVPIWMDGADVEAARKLLLACQYAYAVHLSGRERASADAERHVVDAENAVRSQVDSYVFARAVLARAFGPDAARRLDVFESRSRPRPR